MQDKNNPVARLTLAVLTVVTIAFVTAPRHAHAKDNPACHPPLDPNPVHYVIGYGSLMQEASKRRTWPSVGVGIPVRVRGFERRWNARGRSIGFSTTYLGVRPKAESEIVAALFRAHDLRDFAAGDKREYIYCRAPVPASHVSTLDGSAVPTNANIWIYMLKPERDQPANAKFPIIQSYVDIFLTGCIELSQRVAVKDLDFVAACVATTKGWPSHWVNDRVNPRRPHQVPHAARIDALLHKMLPKQFDAIRLE